MSSERRHELTGAEIHELLSVLDERMRRRGLAASVFVVGGAAIAATGVRHDRVTLDVDGITREPAVIEEARALASERGMPVNWLNSNANMWMPPLPPGVLMAPTEPGLRVTYAADDFLLATKLIAQRTKDADDIVALAAKVGLREPEELEALVRRFYTDEGALEFIIDGNDIDREIKLGAEDAARLIKRRTGQS
ncbi:MAG: hypothetical protein ACRDPS_13955 [Nocardioides sp.]|uniref:hypothetical protein n=1 Tax=Nocardioides sp. TaxID=35761 RepID=UPI003D6B599E